MKLTAAALMLSLLAIAPACKKKGAGKDDTTTATSGTPSRASGGDRDARADTAGTGTVKVDGDDGDAPQFGALYFEFDSATLTADARATLQAVGDWMAKHKSARVTIEGHADERGTTEYNIALGQRRAQAIQEYLAHLGIDANRLATISYGEERPASDGDDESAWAQNRRGELAPR